MNPNHGGFEVPFRPIKNAQQLVTKPGTTSSRSAHSLSVPLCLSLFLPTCSVQYLSNHRTCKISRGSLWEGRLLRLQYVLLFPFTDAITTSLPEHNNEAHKRWPNKTKKTPSQTDAGERTSREVPCIPSVVRFLVHSKVGTITSTDRKQAIKLAQD